MMCLPQREENTDMYNEKRDNAKWKNLYLIRHGESTCNEVNRFAGAIDAPLTALGEAQAKKARGQWKGRLPDVIYASPLLRARTTAQILFSDNATAARPELIIDKRITERNFGDFTLLNKASIQREIGLKKYENALYDDSADMPEGEAFETFNIRVLAFLRDELHALITQNQTVMVVAHKYVIELLSRLILRISVADGYDLRLPNAAILNAGELGHYVHQESRRMNMVQDWITLRYSQVFMMGVGLGLSVNYLS